MVRYPSPPPSASSSSDNAEPSSSSHAPLSSWRDYKDEASAHFNAGNYNEALTSYRNALNPVYHIPDADKQIILSNIVCTRLKLNTPAMASAAISEAKQCIALNPRWAKGHVRLASAYIALGNHSNDACNSLQRALQLEPGNKVARNMLLGELRRDREGRDREEGSVVEPSAPTMEDVQQQQQEEEENGFVYNDGTTVNTASTSQPPPFNPDSFYSPSAPPPPNDYMGSPTAPPPNNNNQDNIDESLTLSQRLQFHYIQLTTWYNNTLSDDLQSLLKVFLALLVLYIAFGGRFGLDSIIGTTPKKGNRGNYGVNNVYEKYRNGGKGGGGGGGYNDNTYSSYNDQTASYQSNKRGYGSSSSYSSSSSNDDYVYSTPPNHRRRTSTSSSSFNSHTTYHMPNLFDGSPLSLLLLLGIGYTCHHFGINPFHLFMLLRMGNRRARNRGGYMGYGAMGGMGMGYGMANQFYRRHYGGAGAAGRRR